jgi:hypothetical protein
MDGSKAVREIPDPLGRKIFRFLFVFWVLFLLGLFNYEFLHYHTKPEACALYALVWASVAAIFGGRRRR